MAAARTRSRRAGAAAVLVIVVIITALAISKAKHFRFPSPTGSGCLVRGGSFDVPLDPSQASIAATIAGVAAHRSMSERAVTIAYAAALQESDLQNLSYGDRDSVGVFQQRPSEGWGTRRQLLNPIYASTRFFAALAAVPNYEKLPIYRAAQAVQHSADGSAYSQYEPQGAAMAGGFSGRRAHAVWCWYGSKITGHSRLSSAEADLHKTFGRLPLSHLGDPAVRVRTRTPAAGWAVASWLVTNASKYRLKQVTYQGFVWTAAHGRKGWTTAKRAARGPAARRGVAFG
ncbi:MAG TPA: hypothetical protein VHJ18_27020 [Streptosporangiaceae bacterium]|nr:hypothetical protein [Streptosporangiaceae bacterium]